MIDDNIVREVEKEMEKDFPHAKVPLQIRPVPKPEAKQQMSLTEQWDVIQRYDNELRERVRKERIDIIAEHDAKWTAIHTNYARELSEMTATLERKKEEAQRALATETNDKLWANEVLQQKLNRA